VLQHGASLLKGDARKQHNELADRYTVLEVLEEGCDRHTRTSEHPGSAYSFGVAFYGGAA